MQTINSGRRPIVSTDNDPKTLDHYNDRYKTNIEIYGRGFDVATSYPCPFCAMPDFADVKVLDTERTFSNEIVCKHCGRGAKLVFSHEQGATLFEVVQTRGDDPPSYLPKMRRIE